MSKRALAVLCTAVLVVVAGCATVRNEPEFPPIDGFPEQWTMLLDISCTPRAGVAISHQFYIHPETEGYSRVVAFILKDGARVVDARTLLQYGNILQWETFIRTGSVITAFRGDTGTDQSEIDREVSVRLQALGITPEEYESCGETNK